MATKPAISKARAAVIAGAQEQVDGQKALASRQVDLSMFIATLSGLKDALTALGLAQFAGKVLVQVDVAKKVQAGARSFTELGGVLVSLFQIRRDVGDAVLGLTAVQATPNETIALDTTFIQCITSARQLLGTRPDVSAVMEDLAAIKELRGGPADATAFHDFHSLKLAFKSVWLHAFDANLRNSVEKLYELVTGPDIDHSPIPVEIGPDALNDVNDVKALLARLQAGADSAAVNDSGIPENVRSSFQGSANRWNLLSTDQQESVAGWAGLIQAMYQFAKGDQTKLDQKRIDDWYNMGIKELGSPQGPSDRLSRLIVEISEALSEPYAFDVFATDTYNFGLMVTHRQEWTPGPYQAGDLVSTIPLAPGETRRFSAKRVVKESRSTKEATKSFQDTSWSQTSIGRAEAEIMHRATTSTNFKLTSNGSFNIGIGSINVTSELGANSELFDSHSSKEFHEATLKAAEDYRKEHSMEVDASVSSESEATSSGEISNPNNELTCTYLFYELQRRYKIHEYLYRVVPVILVAQDVPEPHEIDEAWLITHQWILARVLLDESFRTALNYLTSGFAGDEVSISVLQASWTAQQKLVTKLEALISDQAIMRDKLRETLVMTAERKKIDESYELPTAAKILSFGLAFDPAAAAADKLQAEADSAKARLGYMEQALGDAQKKLTDASAAFNQATQDYSKALQQKFTRHVSIDQLRVHVKQNIVYYMQAIYAHEPTDQRFFRLYKKQVICPGITAGCAPKYSAKKVHTSATSARSLGAPTHEAKKAPTHEYAKSLPSWEVLVSEICVPTLDEGVDGGVGGKTHDLCEVADLDNPIGYKGNYIIFPFIDTCTLVDYMFSNYVDTELGVMDRNVDLKSFNPATFEADWTAADAATRIVLKGRLRRYVSAVRRSTDEIIVPTGQLFIEALPGSHPLLEDFKLEHRLVDVMKARAEVRRDELENLRLASRLVEGQDTKALLGDPHVDKQVVVVSDGKSTILPAA